MGLEDLINPQEPSPSGPSLTDLIAALSQRGPAPGAYMGSMVFPPSGQPSSGLRTIPNSVNRPVVFPDREAPPPRNLDLYGGRKNGQR